MVIIKRRNENKIEVFQISDEDLEQYKIVSAESEKPSSNEKTIDLLKMEYEVCARRYNDLYNSAWTNFSYMALFSGGILTFAGSRFVMPLTAFLACLPLLFWWAATFEPLNRYGDEVQSDLVDSENALNALGVTPYGLRGEAGKGLNHFQKFASREARTSNTGTAIKWAVGLLLLVLSLLIAVGIFLEIPQLQVVPLNRLFLAVGVVLLLALILLIFFRKQGKR